ncbi:CAP-associated domain-containing protein [Paracerasibacillus soli]|uniref:CAP-associated domain-containing protein n=1 Tax=Paracerasibacillus soli TaxID=480284 RepID=A0ABU5CRZ1_9BACI|nr:CAP-associated domain-containing protein [Virgibacillus soli]MDY0409142.1 CAP-associated domain-containing protein [Virgibacillus soli]
MNVEKEVGKPKRSSLNEYDVDWVAYHENYHHFIMVAYDQAEHVAGLYTNQDLLTSTYDIKMGTTRESVRAQLQDPLTSIRKGFIHYQFEKRMNLIPF